MKNSGIEMKILFFGFLCSIVIYGSFWNLVSYWFIVIPIVMLGGVGILGYYLKKRFGRTLGIPYYLLCLIVILAGQYFFSKYFPVTDETMIMKRKEIDLTSFQGYPGSIDAKTEFTKFQRLNDSLTWEKVRLLLSEGKVQEAKVLIERNDETLEEIKQFLFKNTVAEKISDPSNSETRSVEKSSSNETLIGRVSNKTTAYFTAAHPFSLILSVDKQANYIIHEMPAGKSSFFFDNGGYVRVQGGGRKDIKMKTN